MPDEAMRTERTVNDPKELERKLGALGWGLFFIWVGVALLTELSTGIGLLGVGVITLGVQAARIGLGLAIEGFWLLVGLLFTLGAIAELFAVDIPVLPVVLVAAGVLLLLSVLKGAR